MSKQNNFNFMRSVIFFVLCALQLVAAPRSLRTTDINDISTEMLKYHVENRMLSPKIVKRSLQIFIDQFDPGKVYLLHEEVQKYLRISDNEAAIIASRIKGEDFSSYWDMMNLFQKSVERERQLRKEIISNLEQTKSFDLSYSFDLEEYQDFAYSREELKNRIQRDIYNRIKADAKEQGFEALSNEQLVKQLKLINRKEERFENIFLMQNSKGKPVSLEKKENLFTTLVLKSIAKSLDAHTAFFSPEEATSMRTSLQKQFKGIGVVIKEGLEGAYIGDLIPGGPAHKSEVIQKGDVLIQVNGKNVKNLPFEEILEAMNNQGKTKVKLVLKRNINSQNPETIQVTLKKEVIVMEDDRLSFQTEPVAGGVIGKINMSSFYDNGRGVTSEKDLREALFQMKKQGNIRGLVLDFRENSGGFLTQAVKVSGVFVPKGIIVISKYAHGEVQYSRDIDGRQNYAGPLVILTSKASASAAEVVAQALQDYGVAIVVGDDRTYGKGSMQIQNITDENAEAFFKVTVGRYYTISGRSTQIDGVIADIHVPTKYAPFEIGEKYLRYPLPRDELGFSFLDQESMLKEYSKKDPRQIFSSYFPKQEKKWIRMLPQLKTNSEIRIEKDKNFQQFLSDVDQIKRKTGGYPKTRKYGLDDLQMKEAVNIIKDMIVLEKNN